jgi:hypothetical protein
MLIYFFKIKFSLYILKNKRPHINVRFRSHNLLGRPWVNMYGSYHFYVGKRHYLHLLQHPIEILHMKPGHS